MTFDAAAHRDSSLNWWEEAAGAWVRHAGVMRSFAAPVSHWMVEQIEPQSGHRVLELAGGLGETGLLAAELVAPAGSVLISDQAEAMIAAARERAAELGITNVDFKVLNAEWIDLPVAGLDAVLCRWGYMLMADPAAALGETRRVLRPGGRLALAVWDRIAANPWALEPALLLSERGLLPAPGGAPGFVPGPFALGDANVLRGLMQDAGLQDVHVEAIDLQRVHADFDEFWESTLDLSRVAHDAVMSLPEPDIADVRAELAERMAAHAGADGSLAVPGRTLVASASA